MSAENLKKLISLEGLQNFETKQDAYNASTFIKRSNIAMDGNEIAITKTEEATGVDAVVLKALTSGSSIDAAKVVSVDGSKLPLSVIPQGAMERLYIAATDQARLALTKSDVQNGDTVKVTATGKMYFIKDEDKLGNADPVELAKAFEEYVVGTAGAVDWSNVQNKPSFGTGASDFAYGNHVHGNITNDGKVGSTADLPLITGTAGAVGAGNWATGANASSATAFVNGADSRLSDSRDPNDHASSKVTAMTGYTKASSAAAIAVNDSLNGAIGKVEYKLDTSISNAGDMGSYAKAQSSSAVATSDSIVVGLGKVEYKVDQAISNAGDMSSYSKAGSIAAVGTSDTVVSAIGKLEAKIDAVASDAEIDEEIFGITE